ncbi:hypothetical protein B0H19DRAFT_1263639 [Mycena capillaripes]|nr:hypothetical protein B0H19DRAFT_1263639 [Mycena capillaripes]
MFRGDDNPVRKLPKYVNAIWIVWCILLVVIYSTGLLFIRKQYAQEASECLRAGHIILGALGPQRHGDSITLAPSEQGSEAHSDQAHSGSK